MRLTCNRKKLLEALQTVGQSAATKTNRPILGNVKAVATASNMFENAESPQSLTLFATDLEKGMRLTYADPFLKIHDGGEFIIPHVKVCGILKEASGDEVSLHMEGSTLHVKTATGVYKLPTDAPAEFPDLDTAVSGTTVTVKSSDFHTAFRYVHYAAGKENTRFALVGVLCEIHEESITLVATDTKRLAVVSIPHATPQHGTLPSGILPVSALRLVDSLAGDSADDCITITLAPNAALFSTSEGVVYTRLVEGRYPPYRDIIPKKEAVTAEITVQVAGFHSAVRQAAIMVDSESQRVKFDFKQDLLTLHAQGATTGQSEVTFGVNYHGKEMPILFDPKFVTEMLHAVPSSEELKICLVSSSRPAVFRLGSAFTYLVMPLSGDAA